MLCHKFLFLIVGTVITLSISSSVKLGTLGEEAGEKGGFGIRS